MKSPDDIKKGLECCASFDSDMCLQCPYDDGHIACCLDKNQDALAYINQLEQRLAQAERERDAAVADLKKDCSTCKNEEIQGTCNRPNGCAGCSNTDCPCSLGDSVNDCWQWRGICEENSKEENNG